MLTRLNDLRRKIALRQFAEDEAGLSTVEYIIILILIAVLAIGVWRSFGQAVQDQVETSTGEIEGLGG